MNESTPAEADLLAAETELLAAAAANPQGQHDCSDSDCTNEQAATEGCLELLCPAPFREFREGAALGTIYTYEQ